MARPVFQSNTGNQSIVTTGTTVNVDFPATPTNNDILLFPLTCGSGGTITPPAGEGWQLADSIDAPGVFSTFFFWKRFLTGMSITESGLFTAASRTGAAIFGTRCFFIRGCTTTDPPFYLGGKVYDTDVNVQCGNVDIAANSAETIGVVLGGRDLNVTATTSAGWTEVFDGGTGTGDDASWYVATAAPASDGALTGPALTLSAACASAWLTMAFSSVPISAGAPAPVRRSGFMV
jgi:hypothetical protein